MSDCQARRAGGPFRVEGSYGRRYRPALHDSGGGTATVVEWAGRAESASFSSVSVLDRIAMNRWFETTGYRADLNAAPGQPPDGNRGKLPAPAPLAAVITEAATREELECPTRL
jgi:hypothetical protein